MEPLEAGERDAQEPGHHHEPTDPTVAEGVDQPVKIDNELYVRDYSRCVLCYKCVEACGVDAQNTFAIAVAGRGFDARISTEYAVPLDASACVYCGNCIGVCPTGALMFTTRARHARGRHLGRGGADVTNTICPYCGVGCELELHVQDNDDREGHEPVRTTPSRTATSASRVGSGSSTCSVASGDDAMT